MDFDLAAQGYVRLERLRRSGQISLEDYRTQLGGLRVTDEQGRVWMVQEQSGQWHVWDGAQWSPQAPTGRPGVIAVDAPPPTMPPPAYAPPYGQPQAAPPVYAPVGAAQPVQAGYVAQPVVPQRTLLARRRPGCVSVTLRMLLWALVWGLAAWAVHSLIRVTPWWAYVGVGLAALGTLVLWVRSITRHGRALRKLARGGAS